MAPVAALDAIDAWDTKATEATEAAETAAAVPSPPATEACGTQKGAQHSSKQGSFKKVENVRLTLENAS